MAAPRRTAAKTSAKPAEAEAQAAAAAEAATAEQAPAEAVDQVEEDREPGVVYTTHGLIYNGRIIPPGSPLPEGFPEDRLAELLAQNQVERA